jgi:polar amino acid transport system permease protein
MELIIQQFFNLDIIRMSLPLTLQGLGVTLLICLLVVPLGLAGGLLFALLMVANSTVVRWVAIVVVDLLRAIPPLVLLVFVYAGLPFAGFRPSPLLAVCIAFFFSNAAYYGEIYRAGLESVPRGQWEAARSTGLNKLDAMAHVVLPQAIRNVLPDLISNTIEVVKLTSIASVVGLSELIYAASMVRASTYNASALVFVAAIYLVALWPCVRLLSRLEHKLGG